jgi:hypothetical protein
MEAIGPISFAIVLVVNIVCAHAAQRIATERGRSRKAWLWLTAFLGPIMLGILVLLPSKRPVDA